MLKAMEGNVWSWQNFLDALETFAASQKSTSNALCTPFVSDTWHFFCIEVYSLFLGSLGSLCKVLYPSHQPGLHLFEVKLKRPARSNMIFLNRILTHWKNENVHIFVHCLGFKQIINYSNNLIRSYPNFVHWPGSKSNHGPHKVASTGSTSTRGKSPISFGKY